MAHFAEIAFEHVVKEHEGHAAEEHENDDNPVEIGVVVKTDAQVFGRVARCGDGAEGVAEGFEKRHAAGPQQQGLQQVQSQVDAPQPDHGVPVAGLEFLFGDHLARA
jgi:hypothetical protein